MAGRLEGRVAVVTGGASGIGRAIAEAYLGEGASVVLGDRNAELLSATAQALGERCATSVGDVTVEADVEQLVATAVNTFGRLDVGVNGAGFATLAPVVDHDVAAWREVVDVCLTGVFLSVKHEARAMQAGGGGAIVNIASINARQPGQGMSAYCSAKAAVEMLTRVAAMAACCRGSGWRGSDPGSSTRRSPPTSGTCPPSVMPTSTTRRSAASAPRATSPPLPSSWHPTTPRG